MDRQPIATSAPPAPVAPRAHRPRRTWLPWGVRRKLLVAVGLMAVIPLLILEYILANHVLPQQRTLTDLSLVATLATAIALLGFSIVQSLVFPVVRLAAQAQAIAEGDAERPGNVQGPDELGQLGGALDQIARRVRENLTQLRVYGEQTKHLNLEINRRILSLSDILQVSNLITQSANIEEVRAFTLQKLSQLEELDLNLLLEPSGEPPGFLVHAAAGADAGLTATLRHTKLASPWLQQVFSDRRLGLADAAAETPPPQELLRQLGGMANVICQPLTAMGHSVGLLCSANRRPDFQFSKDLVDLLKIYAKQLSIAMENDLLAHQIEESQVMDERTGLYSAGYLKARLEEEIRRATRYHRACSLVAVHLAGLRQVQERYGHPAADELLRQAATTLKERISEVDRVGRVGPEMLALILPERNRREARELAEALRQRIEAATFLSGRQPIPHPFAVGCGVSENPVDGATGAQLLAKAVAEAQGAASHAAG